LALVPKHIQELSPYKPGKPISEVQRELGLARIIKLASNENPRGLSPQVISAVEKALAETHRYPDSAAYELRTKLAQKFKLNLNNVVLGAGSEGIMSTIMRTFLRQGDEIVAAQNSFIGFRVLANASGNAVNWVPMRNYHYDLDAMAEAVTDYTKIVYLANPDNPTGTYFNVSSFDAFMDRVPDRVLVLLDEAYFEYAQDIKDYPDSMHYRYDNVVTLRTFSKAYGLAGFRVGYGFAHEKLISNLMKVKLPFEPSIPAQAAAMAALEDETFLQESLQVNKEGMALLQKVFTELDMDYIGSAANFITLVFEESLEAETFCETMLQSGVILRHLAGFGLMECVRVTIGTEDENNIFIEQLSKMKEGTSD